MLPLWTSASGAQDSQVSLEFFMRSTCGFRRGMRAQGSRASLHICVKQKKEALILFKVPDIYPAHASSPFVRPHSSGVIFSAVFPKNMKCGLQLIHIPDGETIDFEFTDEYRVGRVCSVMLNPFDAGEWLYRYRSGDLWIPDPHAYAICKIKILEDGVQKEITACSCDPLRAADLFDGAPEKPLPPADWSKQVVYGMHVRGFTAAFTQLDESIRGTFAGAAARIPYLKDLGITAVEIMPVYTPLPDRDKKTHFRTMQEALGAYPVGPNGDPMRDLKHRPNYWGFGVGLYCMLRSEYGTQKEFARMVHAFHEAGIRVILLMYFEKGIPAQEQIEILHFYIDRYGIDGFRLKGSGIAAGSLSTEPSLADTALFCHDFPFEEMKKETEATSHIYYTDLEKVLAKPEEDERVTSPEIAEDRDLLPQRTPVPVPERRRLPQMYPLHDFSGLITCSDDFQNLLRRFVKSDDYAMKDFLKLFLTAPDEHGILRYVTNYNGFTLEDLVSYNERHNEANGEFGLDGREDNYSWNCGTEGETEDEEVLSLRRKQVRNFLTLLLLSRGTPMLWQGDERSNSQKGNNNAYCQDNEISWVDWSDSPQKKALTNFTARLVDFRKDHPVFTGTRPFHYMDYLGIGSPDISLHGAEAWKPDLGPFSHSIGIAFCENYAEGAARRLPAFTYLAINMYWKDLSLALPKLPPHYMWKVCMDTASEEGFPEKMTAPQDQHFVEISPRSIQILRAVPDTESIRREKAQERMEKLPSAGAVRRDLRRKKGSQNGASTLYPSRVLRLMKTMTRPSIRP